MKIQGWKFSNTLFKGDKMVQKLSVLPHIIYS